MKLEKKGGRVKRLPIRRFPRMSKSAFKAVRPLLGRFDTTPLEMFRIQAGRAVKLRDHAVQSARNLRAFDLHLHDGLVLPRPGPNFEGPNGMSLRPNGYYLQELVRTFESRYTCIYRIPESAQNGVVLITIST